MSTVLVIRPLAVDPRAPIFSPRLERTTTYIIPAARRGVTHRQDGDCGPFAGKTMLTNLHQRAIRARLRMPNVRNPPMISAIKRQLRHAASGLFARFGYDLVPRYPSETSKCRASLEKFCRGCGLDLGPGGDPINTAAIRVDLADPYAHVGALAPQLVGDAARLHWFQEGVLDYVYSSHLLEDFLDTEAVLNEWLRVLKPGGRLILFCPDEQAFRRHCEKTRQPYNENHKIVDFSLAKVKETLPRLRYQTKILFETPLISDYSWELVVEKL
jgi:predicted SAM-dependent methyltransferase